MMLEPQRPWREDLAFRVAELERRLANVVRPGVIREVDADRALVRVQYDVGTDGEPAVTAWRPWVAARAGTTLAWSAPSAGEQVLLLAPTGELEQVLRAAGALPARLRAADRPGGARAAAAGGAQAAHRGRGGDRRRRELHGDGIGSGLPRRIRVARGAHPYGASRRRDDHVAALAARGRSLFAELAYSSSLAMSD